MRYEKPEYEGDSRPETQKHIDKVNEFGKQFADKLKSRLILHDASKLIEPECKFFDKGTPNLAVLMFASVNILLDGLFSMSATDCASAWFTQVGRKWNIIVDLFDSELSPSSHVTRTMIT